MTRKLADEVFKRIISLNHKESIDSIPHSDNFMKSLESSMGIDGNTYNRIIKLLRDSHKILIFTITKEDVDRNMEKVEGYVDADISTVRKLKEVYQRILVDTWEEEHRERKSPYQIMRDLLPVMNSISRTPLGTVFNKAFMLDEFEKLLEKEYPQYSEDWKAQKLEELLKEGEASPSASRTEQGNNNDADKSTDVRNKNRPNKNQRAVDQNPIDSSGKFSINKLLQIYGIDFFLRSNLRKYKFDYINDLIETRQLNRKSDLKLLREMVQTIKLNISNDPSLSENLDKINRLERTVARFINLGI